jgi:hypothetical protein
MVGSTNGFNTPENYAIDRARGVDASGDSFALGTAMIRSQVFSMPVTDPIAMGAVIVLMSIAAALACLIPARRASRVEPMIALRNE